MEYFWYVIAALGSAVTTYTYAKHKNIDLRRGSVMLVCILGMCTVGSYAAFLAKRIRYGHRTRRDRGAPAPFERPS